MSRDILSICIAYEQGVGKGRKASCKREDNPYLNDDDCYKAWDYGWTEGTNWLAKIQHGPKTIPDCGPV